MNLIESVKKYASGVQTLAEWLGDGAVCVDYETAQTRANICLKCPERKKTNIVDRWVADGIRRRVELKNKLQLRVAGEKALGSCGVCDCVNRLKIWLPIEKIVRESNENELSMFPDHCWIRKEKA